MTEKEFEKAIKKLNEKEEKLYDEIHKKIEKEKAEIFIKYIRCNREGDYIVFYPSCVMLRNNKRQQTRNLYPIISNISNIIQISPYSANEVVIYFNEEDRKELLEQKYPFTTSVFPEDYYFFETLEAAKLFIEANK